MKKLRATFFVVALLIAGASCRMVKTLTGVDQNLKRVGDLWSDVPQMDGLTSSEAELPLFVHVLMRTALNNLYRLNKEGEDKTPATGDWAAFSTTKLPQDVQTFYSNERMTSFGNWQANKNSTCLNGNEHGFNGVACVFAKEVNKHGIGLLIVAVADDKKQTNVFFVRVEKDEASNGTPNASPSVNR